MGVVADGQTEHRRRILERPTPVGEVIRPAGIAGEPRRHVAAEAVQSGFLGVIHRLDQPVVPDEFPVLGNDWLPRSLVEIACGAELRGPDDPRAQPARPVDGEVTLPYR